MDQFWGTSVGLIVIALLIMTAVLWFLLPFAVFGVKARIDRAIDQARIANRRLESIESVLRIRLDQESISTEAGEGILPGSPASLNSIAK